MEASRHVQSFEIFLLLENESHYSTNFYKAFSAVQCGVLSVLDQLRTLQIRLRIGDAIEFDDPEGYADLLRNKLVAISQFVPTARREIFIGEPDECDILGSHVLLVLARAFEGLGAFPIAKLHLQEISQDEEITDNLSDALSRLAPGLQELVIERSEWLFGRAPIAMPALRRLCIEFDDGSDHLSLPELVQWINASATCLQHLSLHFGNPLEYVPIGGQVTSLVCPKLVELELEAEAMASLRYRLRDIPCTCVSVMLPDARTCASLKSLLTQSTPAAFPNLSRLKVCWEPTHGLRSRDGEACRSLLTSVGHRFDVEIDLRARDVSTTYVDLASWLQAAATYLVSCTFRISAEIPARHPSTFLSVPAGFPKLQKVPLRMLEYLHKNTAGTPSMAALLRLLKAPVLQQMGLDVRSPYTDYLPVLQGMIERPADLPDLRAVSGMCRLALSDSSDKGWDAPINAHRRKRFIEACKARRIDLTELTWSTIMDRTQVA